jgi:hypothetical protein
MARHAQFGCDDPDVGTPELASSRAAFASPPVEPQPKLLRVPQQTLVKGSWDPIPIILQDQFIPMLAGQLVAEGGAVIGVVVGSLLFSPSDAASRSRHWHEMRCFVTPHSRAFGRNLGQRRGL